MRKCISLNALCMGACVLSKRVCMCIPTFFKCFFVCSSVREYSNLCEFVTVPRATLVATMRIDDRKANKINK